MTTAAPLSAELCDSPCSVDDCLEPAQLIGSATVSVNTDSGAHRAVETVTFGLPLCADHAQVLRLGCSLTHFNSGL